MILLDSSTLVHYIRGVPAVVDHFQGCPRRELRVPSVVAYEILYGLLKSGASRRATAVKALLEALVQVPFDSAAAGEAARIRTDLEARGLTIGPMDLLIAGTAVSRGAVLVTSNTRELRRVKHLQIANWAA